MERKVGKVGRPKTSVLSRKEQVSKGVKKNKKSKKDRGLETLECHVTKETKKAITAHVLNNEGISNQGEAIDEIIVTYKTVETIISEKKDLHLIEGLFKKC